MKRYILTMLLAIAAVFAHADNSLWKAYMAYHDITRIEQGGKRLYVLASGNLFTYNTSDGEVRTFDKCNGLSDCAISHIAWCQQAARLVIVYSNQNIDLMSGRNNDDITNLPDYYRKSMTEDKTINHVCIDGVYAYLSTGFGIVKVNVKNAEISETYNLHTPVAYSYVEGGYLYAAQRGKGIYRAALGTNMMDPANWTYARAYSDIWETPDSKLLDMVKDLDRGGLKYNNFGCLRFYNGRLYTVGGGYTVSQDLHLPGGIQVYDGGNWEVYQDDVDSQLGDGFFEDINAIDVDPRDANHVFVSGRTGIYEFSDRRFVRHYSYDNSALSPTYPDDKMYVVVHDVKFDTEGNLWALNSINKEKNIIRLGTDGQWTSLYKEPLKSLTNLRNITFDSRSLMWFVNDSWKKTGLFCYQPSSDAINSYTSFINQDARRRQKRKYMGGNQRGSLRTDRGIPARPVARLLSGEGAPQRRYQLCRLSACRTRHHHDGNRQCRPQMDRHEPRRRVCNKQRQHGAGGSLPGIKQLSARRRYFRYRDRQADGNSIYRNGKGSVLSGKQCRGYQREHEQRQRMGLSESREA